MIQRMRFDSQPVRRLQGRFRQDWIKCEVWQLLQADIGREEQRPDLVRAARGRGFADLVEPMRGVEPERAARRPRERAEVRARANLCTQVARDRAHVGARGAGDIDFQEITSV